MTADIMNVLVKAAEKECRDALLGRMVKLTLKDGHRVFGRISEVDCDAKAFVFTSLYLVSDVEDAEILEKKE